MNKLIKPDGYGWALRDEIRAACPMPGNDWSKFMSVEMKRGEIIESHKHAEHLVLYYPEEAGAVIVVPQPGTTLYLPPGTLHSVPEVPRKRMSIAMLIEAKT